MKKITVALILMLSTYTYSQELKERSWVLKINTLALVDIATFPTVQLSVERTLTKKFSLSAEIGYQLYGSNVFIGNTLDTLVLKEKGFKANIEGRVYLKKLFYPNKVGKNKGLFCGLQVFYRQNQETNTIRYSKIEPKDESLDVYYKDYFGVKKRGFGLNFTASFQVSKKRFIFEPVIGLGIMNRTIKNYNIQYNELTDNSASNHSFRPNLESESGTTFNLSLSLKFGYRL